MKKSIQIQINKPCHENWENMIAAEQGRFCGSCQKTVVDFTNMTDEELLAWVTRPGKDMCGKFNNDQLQRDLVIYPEKKFSFRYMWQLMIASFMIAGKAEGQIGKYVLGESILKKSPKDYELMRTAYAVVPVKANFKIFGSITDSSNSNPIPFASVRIKGTARGVQADSAGRFVFDYNGSPELIELEFSCVGYGSKTVLISNPVNNLTLGISLPPLSDMMGEVVVQGFSQQCRTLTLGGYSTGVVSQTLIEKIKDSITDLFSSKKYIQVYPNPIAPGSSINLVLSLKQTGQYKLELVDAAGKSLLSKSITAGNGKQQESIPTSLSWSKGVYYLRISQPGKKFNKTAKVLLQ